MSPITRNRMKESNTEDIPDLHVRRRTRRSIYITSHDGETVICRRKSLSPVCTGKENVTTPKKNNKTTTALNCENLNDKGTPERLTRPRSCSTSKKSVSSIVNKATSDSSPLRNLRNHNIFDSSCTTENDSKFKRNLNSDLSKSEISPVRESGIKYENEVTSVKSMNEKLTKNSGENFTQLVGKNNKTTIASNDKEGTPKILIRSRSCSTGKKSANSIVSKATSDSSPQRNLRSHSIIDSSCTTENDTKFKRNLYKDLTNSEISSLSKSNIESENEVTSVKSKNKKLSKFSGGNSTQFAGNKKNSKTTTVLNGGNLNDKEGTPEKRSPRTRSCSTSKKTVSSIVSKATNDSSSQRNLKPRSVFDNYGTTENIKLKRNLYKDLSNSEISSLSESDIESENETICIKSNNKKLRKFSEKNCTQFVENKSSYSLDDELPLSKLRNKLKSFKETFNLRAVGVNYKTYNKNDNLKQNIKECESNTNNLNTNCEDVPRDKILEDKGKILEGSCKTFCIELKNLHHGLSEMPEGDTNNKQKDDDNEMHQVLETNPREDGSSIVSLENKSSEMNQYNIDSKEGEGNVSEGHSENGSSKVFSEDDVIDVHSEVDTSQVCCEDDSSEVHHEDDNNGKHGEDHTSQTHGDEHVSEMQGRDVTREVQSEDVTREVQSEDVTREVQSEDVTREVQSEDVTREAQSEDVTREVQSEDVTREVQSEDVTREVQSEDVTREAQSEDVTREAQSEDVTREAQSKDVTREAQSEDVTREAQSEDVTREAQSEDVTREAQSEDVTREAQSEDVTREAQSEDVTREAQSKDVTREAQSEDVTREAQSEDVTRDAQGEDVTREAQSKDVTRETQSEDVTREVQSKEVIREMGFKDSAEDVPNATLKFHQVIVNAHPRCNDVNEEHHKGSKDDYECCIENKMHSIGNVSDNEDENNYPPSPQHLVLKYSSDDSENTEEEKMNAIRESNVLEGNVIENKEVVNCVTNGVNVEDERYQGSKHIIKKNKDFVNDSAEESISSIIMKEDAGDRRYQITKPSKKRKSYEIAEVGNGIYDDNKTAERKKIEKEERENEIDVEGEKDEKEDEEENDMDDEEEEKMEDEEEEEMEDDEKDETEDEEEEMEDEEEEAETDNKRRSNALQFIDFEAEEGETDYEDDEEDEECEEEEEEDSEDDDYNNYSESESEEISTVIKSRNLARKFLDDEAVDEDIRKKKRKRILVIESDEEVDDSSMKELSIDNNDNSLVEGRKGKSKDSLSPMNKKSDPNLIVHIDGNHDDQQEGEKKVTETSNILDTCETPQKMSEIENVFSTGDKQLGESFFKMSVVEEVKDQEGVLERSDGSHSRNNSKEDVRVMEITVVNKKAEFNEGIKSLVEEICKETEITEVKFNDEDMQSKDETSEIFIKDSNEKLRADSVVSKEIGEDKFKKKNKCNKDSALSFKVLKDYKMRNEELTSCEKPEKEFFVAEKKHEQMGSNLQSSKAAGKKIKKHSKNKLDESIDGNEKSKSENYKSETMLKTSKKNMKKIEIGVGNERKTDFEKGKCYAKEVLDTKIMGLESNDKIIYKSEDVVQTSVNCVKKQRPVSNKLKNIGEEKILKKRKRSEQYAISEVLEKKPLDKMLICPEKSEKEFVVPEKKRKLMRSNVKSIMTLGKKMGKFTISYLGKNLAVEEKLIMQNDEAKNILEETSSSKSAQKSLELQNMFQVTSLKSQTHKQLAGMFNSTSKIKEKGEERNPMKRDVYRRIAKYVAISNKWIVTHVCQRESEKVPVGVWDIKDIKELKLKRKFFWNGSNWAVDKIYLPFNSEWIVTNNIRKKKNGPSLINSDIDKKSEVEDESKTKYKVEVNCVSGEWSVKDLRQFLKLS